LKIWRSYVLAFSSTFLLRQRDTGLGPSRRIPDHPGEVADEKDHLMPEVLKVLELVNENGMTEVKIRCRWDRTPP
jgi:hypothetical protein